MKARALAVLSVLMILCGLGYLFVQTIDLTYAYPVEKVLGRSDDYEGRRIRVDGYVARDSISWNRRTMEYDFHVGANPFAEETVRVRYRGVAPDTFKNDAQVTVTGRFRSDGTFEATELLAKCPSKYEAREKEAGTYGSVSRAPFDADRRRSTDARFDPEASRSR